MEAPWRVTRPGADDAGIWQTLLLRFYASDPLLAPMDEARARRQTEAILALSGRETFPFLLWRDAAPAGYALLVPTYSVEYDGRVVWLEEIFVDDAYRGQGAGGAFLRHLEAWAKAEGFRRMLLEVTDDNPGAARLYARHGFAMPPRRVMTKPLMD